MKNVNSLCVSFFSEFISIANKREDSSESVVLCCCQVESRNGRLFNSAAKNKHLKEKNKTNGLLFKLCGACVKAEL